MADLIPVHALVNGSVILHYFRTSDVYRESGGIGDKVGIKKISAAELDGSEEIVPVKELLRSGAMQRIGVRYKDAAGNRRSAKVLVNTLKLGAVFGDAPGGQLQGVEYQIGTDKASKGEIINVGGLRRASYY